MAIDAIRAAAAGFVPALLAIVAGAALADTPHPREHATHWGYGTDNGPAHWATMNPEFATCGIGTAQTPVDLDPASAATGGVAPKLSIGSGRKKLQVLDNGHTIQVSDPSGSALQLGDARYQLVQFHFHAPSEHTLRGKHYAMELHLVHKREDGGLAVLGVLIESGAENKALAPLWAAMPTKGGEQHDVSVAFDVGALLPADHSVFRYKGSLTTPPCSEGVEWTVFEHPITLSPAQIDAFRKTIGEDNRPVQPLNGRSVMRTELSVGRQ